MNTRNLAASRRTIRRGFTLIELLVVVSIIALLLSILLPSLRAAKDQAKTTACLANLHAIYMGLVSYGADNKQCVPDYKAMGGWGFRVAPGRKAWKSPYPEAYGVQAVLHNGGSPEIMPNGLPKYVQRSPVHLPGDSKVWICPANPGPRNCSEWASYGNTYHYRSIDNATNRLDDETGLAQPAATNTVNAYNLEVLNSPAWRRSLAKPDKDGHGKTYEYIDQHYSTLVKDNWFLYPVPSAFGRPTKVSDYGVKTVDARAPHRTTARSVAYAVHCYLIADGRAKFSQWPG